MANPASSSAPPLSASLVSPTTHPPAPNPPWLRSSQFFPSRLLSPRTHFSNLRTTTQTASSTMENRDFYPDAVGSCSCSMQDASFPPLQCPECMQECPEDPCAVQLSSECTEECVVVACTDDHHTALPCGVDHPVVACEPCDAVCHSSPDCTGLEEFFQCCTDHHEYMSEPRSLSSDMMLINNAFTWDSSLTDLLCACSDPSHFGQPHASGSVAPSVGSAPSTPHFHPAQTGGGALSAAHSATSTPQLTPSPTFQSPQPPSLPNKCEWAGCVSSFSSLAELVGHVNLQHLRLPSAPEAAPLAPVHQPAAVNVDYGTAGPLSCLWADCQVYPTPQSVPGPSSGSAAGSVLGVLANHLLEHHLGLHPRSPSQGKTSIEVPLSPTVSSSPSLFQPFPGSPSLTSMVSPRTSSSASVHGPPTPQPEHDCAEAAAHVCRWSECGQSFASCDALTAHISTAHVGGGRAHYDCHWEGCTRHGDHGFASKQKILRHLQSHTGHRPFQCKVCQQNFSEAATLAQHMRRHTQEKPYICDFPGCGKAFAITGALTIHKRTHNGHKPFKCKHCDRAFAESSNLSKHLRTHTGARPYNCPKPGCSKSFARPDQLARHQNVHKKKPSPPGAAVVAAAA